MKGHACAVRSRPDWTRSSTFCGSRFKARGFFFFFLFGNAGYQQTKTCHVSLKPTEWLLKRWTQQVKATRWRNVSVPGRNEMAEQLGGVKGFGQQLVVGRGGRSRLFPWLPLFLFLIKKLIIFLLINSNGGEVGGVCGWMGALCGEREPSAPSLLPTVNSWG